MLSVKSSNPIESLDLNLNSKQKPKLLMILKGLQIIIEKPDLFKNLLSEIEQYLLFLKTHRPQELKKYIQMIKTGPENRENVKKSLEKKIKDILNKIEFDNLNKTSVRPIGYGKKSKKRKKSKSRTNKRVSKKSNKKKMRGGSQSLGEYLQQPMVIIMILFSIFVFIEGVPWHPLWIIVYLMIGFGLYDIKVMTDIRNRRNRRIRDEQQNLEGIRSQPDHWADTFPGVVNRAMVMGHNDNSSAETVKVYGSND